MSLMAFNPSPGSTHTHSHHNVLDDIYHPKDRDVSLKVGTCPLWHSTLAQAAHIHIAIIMYWMTSITPRTGMCPLRGDMSLMAFNPSPGSTHTHSPS